MNYSEEILRMYPYLAEPDSDGDDDIEEGEEDEYVRWDPVQKVHVKRETPLREIAKRNADTIPTAETERFLPEDMVTVEILLKMVSEADDFSLNSTAPEISPTRASTPPNTSIPESLPLPNAHLNSEHDRPLEAYDDLPTTRQQDELFIEQLGHQNNDKNINLLPECVLQDLQQKAEETRVKSDFKESCTTSNCPGLPKALSGETSCLQNEANNCSLVTEDMEAVNEDAKPTEGLEKVFAEPSRYFVEGIKNRLLQNLHFNECNPEHRFHGFRGCKSSRRATIIYRRTYKRPMSRVTYQPRPLRKQWGARLDNDQTIPVSEDIDKNRPEIGDYYSCEFTPSTKREATDLGNKNLWGVLEVDNNAKLTHSIDNYSTSLGMFDFINCGYMPLEKPISVAVGGYFGFSASISENIPDYDRELVDRCLSATKKRSGPVSVTEPLDTLPDMARDLAYQKGEAAGRQQMLEVAMKLANEIIKQKLCNAFSEKSKFLDTDLTIKRSLQQAALGSYEDHTQHEGTPNHARAIRERHSPHTELEEVKNQHGKKPIDWSNKKTNEFRRSCGISDHSLKEYPSSLKNSGEKRKHYEEFDEVKGSSRKHRRRRSASKENDSRRYRQQDKSRSRSGPSQDSGRRYDEKDSPSRPQRDAHRRHDDSDIPDRSYNDSRRRQDRSHSASKSRELDRRLNEKNSPSKSHKGSRRRNDDIDSPGKSHKDPYHRQHDEVKSPSTNYKGSRRKKSERETEKSHTKAQDRSPNRGRHRDRDCESSEYHAAEKIIGDIVRRKRKHSTPSPSPPPLSLVKVKPQKEIRESIFATPNEVNEQKRSGEASRSRRSSQKHHQNTPISDTIRDIKVKKAPIAGKIAAKEKSATPKVTPTNLTDQKEATSKDSQASQTDVRPTTKARRSLVKEGTDKEVCEVEVRKSLDIGKRSKRAFSNDGPSITKKAAGKEASPQIKVQQTSKIWRRRDYKRSFRRRLLQALVLKAFITIKAMVLEITSLQKFITLMSITLTVTNHKATTLKITIIKVIYHRLVLPRAITFRVIPLRVIPLRVIPLKATILIAIVPIATIRITTTFKTINLKSTNSKAIEIKAISTRATMQIDFWRETALLIKSS
ncbi:uncharacterized protein LAJ45_06070 [Morchella importuna]|uniref:uncharacterized protein n=1 Tax=Morchella importuna TaxID=1174673 RepID=UPI001E8EB837|nr:uncharacterized protein LAJ45_06070 [Morchella importuna]KAH8149918.1 hypothetical protein LAJ45_06070 [Morchella importuna]